MDGYRFLQNRIRDRASELRAFLRIVESPVFQRAWDAATDDERAQLRVTESKLVVQDWLKRAVHDDLLTKSLKELRDIAKRTGVPYYHELDKSQLLSALAPRNIHA